MMSMAALVLFACTSPSISVAGATDDSNPNGIAPSQPDGGDVPAPVAEPATEPVRFVALGDAGTGDENQLAVAQAIAQVCAASGCDFALYLGDNVYSDGVTSADDEQWASKFEAPYAGLDFPFHAVLGNHDYGGGGGGLEEARAQAQVDYAALSDKFRMPARYYSHVEGDATFVGLDTTPLDWGQVGVQDAWVDDALASVDTKWTIAYGHHPYLSNGSHGNANENFGPFFEAHVCGKADVYLAGHDHDLQWIETTCAGTELIVSGGGGAGLYSGSDANPARFVAESHGFLWAEIDGDTFTGVFYDATGAELYRRTLTL